MTPVVFQDREENQQVSKSPPDLSNNTRERERERERESCGVIYRACSPVSPFHSRSDALSLLPAPADQMYCAHFDAHTNTRRLCGHPETERALECDREVWKETLDGKRY